jgi:hypothetical protein
MLSNEKFDHMIKMREQSGLAEENVLRLKEKYNNAKKRGASRDTLNQIQSRYNHRKRSCIMYQTEYDQLKSDIGYNSLQCNDLLSGNGSDSSDSSDDSNDIGDC